ncbi:MAG TPA: Asp-tRNA(Asn)/Glu-tRNA(Gln) amidotransferase subunit GatC [Gammaproteobacteria bacterium]|nr:Asp-tRNA(Asn)/Glu-tRNA(Gln) amidotransferase subunit GatC [Gammaproteobacteria bacterium]
MSKFEEKDIQKVAHLARLSLEAHEITAYAENMRNILQLIEQMNQVNTEKVSPMAHPMENVRQRLRKDTITEPNLREQFQSIAPSTEAGLYLVPQVIEDLVDH